MAIVPVVLPGCYCGRRYPSTPREERETYVLYRRKDPVTNNWFIVKWRWEKLKYAATDITFQGEEWVAYRYRVVGDGDEMVPENMMWWDDVDVNKTISSPFGGIHAPPRKHANLDTGEGVQYDDYDYRNTSADTSRGDSASKGSWIRKVLQGALRMWKS